MAMIVTEIKCLHCGEDKLENFDIKFMDELGFPDENWNMTSGTQCNTCFERVSWRRVPEEPEALQVPSEQSMVICQANQECVNPNCVHRVPHVSMGFTDDVDCTHKTLCRYIEKNVGCINTSYAEE